MSTLANNEDPDEMRHTAAFSSASTLFVKVKKDLQTKEYNIFNHYNRTHLDMYNGLSKPYCIKPEGKLVLVLYN